MTRKVYSRKRDTVVMSLNEAALVAEQLRDFADVLGTLGLEERRDEVNFSAYALEHAK